MPGYSVGRAPETCWNSRTVTCAIPPVRARLVARKGERGGAAHPRLAPALKRATLHDQLERAPFERGRASSEVGPFPFTFPEQRMPPLPIQRAACLVCVQRCERGCVSRLCGGALAVGGLDLPTFCAVAKNPALLLCTTPLCLRQRDRPLEHPRESPHAALTQLIRCERLRQLESSCSLATSNPSSLEPISQVGICVAT